MANRKGFQHSSLDVPMRQVFAEISLLLSTSPTIAGPFLSLLPQAPFHLLPRGTEDAFQVLRHWAPSLEQAGEAWELADLAEALAELSPSLRWRQNPNYRERPPSPDFLANYAYTEIAGPYGLVAADIRCGVLLLGPGTFYPAHRHPAEEIYIPLTVGGWQYGDDGIVGGAWSEKAPGSVIHHPSQVPHAMMARATPLAAFYLWRGDLATEATLG